jgi:transposase
MRARHRLSKLLLRHGMMYDATAWTRAHDAWLRRQRFQSGPLAIVFDECYGLMLDARTRRDALDKAITELASAPPYVDVVERLVCVRPHKAAGGQRARRSASAVIAASERRTARSH